MKNKKSFLLALTIILFIFNILLLQTTLFIFKIGITKWNIVLSLITTIITSTIIMKKQQYKLKETIITLSTFIFILITSILISEQIYDTTYDSNTYHKAAIGALKNGWNPNYETIEEFNKSEKNNIKVTNTYSLWTDHYAKGYWIYAANIYKITNNIESGKSLYLLTIISTLLICYSILSTKFKKFISFMISSLVALNPITICQFCTYYNDGLLGNYLIIMLLSLTLIVNNKELINKKLSYLLYFLTLVILINIKFTGFAYAGIYSLIYYIYTLINKEKRKTELKKITLIGVISLILGLGLIGYSTYITNIKKHNNLFYPLYGTNRVDIMTNNAPKGLYETNRINRFLIANFGETYNRQNETQKEYKLKIPFTIKKEELKYYINPDVRIGGYGPLFSGMLLISIILLIHSLKQTKEKNLYALPLIGTLSLIIILKDTWWARYLPQLYLIPIISIILFNTIKTTKKKAINLIFISLLTLNSILVTGPQTLILLEQKIKIEKEFKKIKKISKKEELIITTNEFTGGIYNIHDKHNKIKIKSEIEDKNNYIEYTFMGPRVNIHCYLTNTIKN